VGVGGDEAAEGARGEGGPHGVPRVASKGRAHAVHLCGEEPARLSAEGLVELAGLGAVQRREARRAAGEAGEAGDIRREHPFFKIYTF
jgi:hypothetical protein